MAVFLSTTSGAGGAASGLRPGVGVGVGVAASGGAGGVGVGVGSPTGAGAGTGSGAGTGAGSGAGTGSGAGAGGAPCAIARAALASTTQATTRRTIATVHDRQGAMPHVTRGFLPRSCTSVTREQTGGDESLADGVCLIVAVLDDERPARLEVLARSMRRFDRRTPCRRRLRRARARARAEPRPPASRSRRVAMYGGFEHDQVESLDPRPAPTDRRAESRRDRRRVALGIALARSRPPPRRRRSRRPLLPAAPREAHRDRARAGAEVEHAARRRPIAHAAQRATSMTVSVSGRGTSTCSST